MNPWTILLFPFRCISWITEKMAFAICWVLVELPNIIAYKEWEWKKRKEMEKS